MKIHALTWSQASQLREFILPEVLELPDLEDFWYLASAEMGRGILGLAVIDPQADGPLLLSLAVSPAARREGVASRLLEAAANVVGSNGGAALTVEYSLSPAEWPVLASLLEQNGFFQIQPERYAYLIPLAELNNHPVLTAARQRNSASVFPMSNLSAVALREFRLELERKELFPPDVLRQCDPHLSFFWLEDGHIQACLLLGNCQDGMVENLWTYLSPRARQKQALIYLLGAAVTAAANTLPPDSQVLFSCQTEASDHLVRHLSPSAAPVQSLRVYVRPTLQDQELPEEDAAGREPVTEHEVEEEAMASRELTEEEKKLRAERWNDLQMTPVTEDAPACRNCAHRIAGRLLSCEVYQTKPGPVMYGEACPSFSPVQ